MGRWDRTHEALQQAALDLFAEYGYGATGTAQVAERAGVSEMTLFRHFPTKEALILADSFDPLMAEAVRERPADESPMRALTEGVRAAWTQIEKADVDALRLRVGIIAQTPALGGAIERGSEDTTAALARALTERGADDIQARVAAAALIAGLSAALREWARSEETVLDAVLRSALDVLGGVGADSGPGFVDGDGSGGGEVVADLAVAFQGGGDGGVVGGSEDDGDLAGGEPVGWGEVG